MCVMRGIRGKRYKNPCYIYQLWLQVPRSKVRSGALVGSVPLLEQRRTPRHSTFGGPRLHTFEAKVELCRIAGRSSQKDESGSRTSDVAWLEKKEQLQLRKIRRLEVQRRGQCISDQESTLINLFCLEFLME